MLVSKTRSGGSEIQMLYHSFYSVQSRVNWGCYSATSVVRSQRRLLNLAARSLCLTSRKPPDIRTTAVALGGVVESMVSWKMLQDLHVHIHIWPLCNAGCCTMGTKIVKKSQKLYRLNLSKKEPSLNVSFSGCFSQPKSILILKKCFLIVQRSNLD